MVQRKLSNKTDNTQAIIKFSLQTHDGRCRTPDLKTKRMKKSRSFKQADLEISLRYPSNTPSPKKKATILSPPSSYGSPNYMKSTSNSDAKKELKTTVSSSSHKVAKTKASSSRTGVNRSSKVILCENLKVQRNTCSSTLKDSMFPPYLKLNPGATEAEGTSAMKVCPYNYCSLNGHHHKASPPLRSFLSSKRKLMKTQKLAKPGMLSHRKAKIADPEVDHNEDFFIEIHVPSEDAEEKDNISYEFLYDEEDVDGDKSASVCLDELLGEISDMEWEEGQTNISDQKDDGFDQDIPEFKLDDNEIRFFEDFIAEKLKSYFDEDIMEQECFSDADSVPDSESTMPDEEQIVGTYGVVKEGTIYSGQKDGIADEGTISASPDCQSIETHADFFCECFEEIIEAGNEGRDSDQESVKTQSVEEFVETQSDKESLDIQSDEGDTEEEEKEDNADRSTEETISTDDMIEEIQSKIEYLDGSKEEILMASNDSEVEVNQNEWTKKILEPEAFTVVKDDEPYSKDNKLFNGESESSEELIESCNKSNRWMRRKKESDNNEEEDKEFNPRDPNFLPLEVDPEAEKVDLRHQDMNERRNAEEWMLDYALQKTMNQLAPARKKKVALLVEAFEAVLPVPKYETRMRKYSSGCTHARTLQACS